MNTALACFASDAQAIGRLYDPKVNANARTPGSLVTSGELRIPAVSGAKLPAVVVMSRL